MDSNLLIKKALKSEFLSASEGQFLFETESTANLMRIANYLRQEKFQEIMLHGKLIVMLIQHM